MGNRSGQFSYIFLLFLFGQVLLKKEKLTIYVVSPSDNTFPFSIDNLKPAAYMAEKKVKEMNILPKYDWEFQYLNSGCDPTAAYTEFLKRMQGHCPENDPKSLNESQHISRKPKQFSAIFGPVCSYVIVALSRMNWNIWKVPIITVGAFAQPFRDRYMENRLNVEFNFITAAGYHYKDPAELIVNLCKKYKWKKLAYLSPMSIFDYYYDYRHCSLFAMSLLAAVNKYQSSGGVLEFTKKNLNESSPPIPIKSVFKSTLTTDYKDSSIFVLCMEPNVLRESLIDIQNAGFDNGEYVFINVDLFNSPENLVQPWFKMNDSDNEVARSIYRNVLTVALTPISGEAFQNFSDEIKQIAKKENNFTFPDDKVNSFVAAFYDSIILYAHAVKSVSEPDVDISNGTIISNALKGRSIMGISGNVTIDENGDRNSEYSLLDMDPETGNFSLVATYNGVTKEYTEVKPIDWGKKAAIPEDTPLCGYDNEKCKMKVYMVYFILLGILLFLLAMGVMVGFIIFRNAKFQAELKAMCWLISSDNLESLESRYKRISKKENLSCGSITKDDKKLKRKKAKLSRSQNSSREFLFENLRINKFMYDKIAHPANNHLDTVSHHSNLSIDSVAGVQFSNINNCKLYGCIAVFKGTIVALKRIDSEKHIETSRELLLEVKKLKDLNYHHLCRFIGACLDSFDQFIVYEYCCKGSLKDLLAQNQLVLDWMFKYSLIQDICRGMIYIHNNIGAHGNLKSTKCLVDSRFVLKITGFGCNILSAMDKSHYQFVKDEKYYASLLWTSPERLRTNPHSLNGTVKSDVYSFGIICQEIIYRKSQFYIEENEEMSSMEKINRVKNSFTVPFRPTIYATEGCTDEFVKIVTDAWNENSLSRPDFSAIKVSMRKLNKSGDTSNILDNLLSRMEQYANNLEDLVAERTDQYLEEKRRAESLLYSMLPKSVAQQLIRKQSVIAENYEMVSVYFSDIVGFTSLSAESTPMEIVNLLNKLYTTFDSILEHFDVYKVETIGDAYVVCSGLPSKNENIHAREIGRMSIAFLNELFSFVIPHRPDRKLKLRIGIHSGPVCAGIVGLKMPRYCLFGDTVNTSSRMESSGLPLKIHISSSTMNILSTFNSFVMTERGHVEMKGKGLQLTYWLHGENDNIVDPLAPGDIIITNLYKPC